mmetsp:Transcript_641/g.773  ORF Transcript_641/g.773 Transcript_641/m.773 type:complete len:459 (+) Transcript_641:146-1522(+)
MYTASLFAFLLLSVTATWAQQSISYTRAEGISDMRSMVPIDPKAYTYDWLDLNENAGDSIADVSVNRYNYRLFLALSKPGSSSDVLYCIDYDGQENSPYPLESRSISVLNALDADDENKLLYYASSTRIYRISFTSCEGTSTTIAIIANVISMSKDKFSDWLYFVTSDSSDVFRLDVTVGISSRETIFTDASSASISLDSTSKLLYLALPNNGTIMRYNVADGSIISTSGFDSPKSISVDHISPLIYFWDEGFGIYSIEKDLTNAQEFDQSLDLGPLVVWTPTNLPPVPPTAPPTTLPPTTAPPVTDPPVTEAPTTSSPTAEPTEAPTAEPTSIPCPEPPVPNSDCVGGVWVFQNSVVIEEPFTVLHDIIVNGDFVTNNTLTIDGGGTLHIRGCASFDGELVLKIQRNDTVIEIAHYECYDNSEFDDLTLNVYDIKTKEQFYFVLRLQELTFTKFFTT